MQTKDTPAYWISTLDHNNSSRLSDKQLRDILHEATTSINIDKYRNDPLLLNIWLQFIKCEIISENANYAAISELFTFLKSSRIGFNSSAFYKEWSLFEYKSGYIEKAKTILFTAIQLKIEPISDLQNDLKKLCLNSDVNANAKIFQDKENVYPVNRKLQTPSFDREKQKKPLGIKSKSSADFEALTPDDSPKIDSAISLPNIGKSVLHTLKELKKENQKPCSNSGNSDTSPPNLNNQPRKTHQARLLRFQSRPGLGPPSRQPKNDNTIPKLDLDITAKNENSNSLNYNITNQKHETISFPDMELTMISEIPLESEINTSKDMNTSITEEHTFKFKPYIQASDNKPLLKNMIVLPEKKSLDLESETPFVEYQIPLKAEQIKNEKKIITVNGIPYQRMEIIGRGGSSKVYKVMDPKHDRIFALKKVKLCGEDPSVTEGYRNEIDLLLRLKGNSHIIQLIDSEISKDAIFMILEFGEIDLATILKRNQNLSSNSVKMYWEQMLNAVHAIHEQNIIHSDLKPANFLLVEGSLRLIDFGIAKTIPNDTTNIQRDAQTGTINFMSPESIMFVENQESKYLKLGRASDVWSLGCILYQMLYGAPPFAHITPVGRKLACIVNPMYEIQYENRDLNAIESIKGCLIRDQKSRWTIPKLLQHSFLSNEKVIISEEEVFEILKYGMHACECKEMAVNEQLLRKISKAYIRDRG